MTTLFSKIKEVTELAAISGHEAPVRAYLREKLTPHVDEVVTDGLGSIFGIKHSEAADAPRVLVASHMDEVGFMFSEIQPDGTFRVVEIGGWNPMVVSSQRFISPAFPPSCRFEPTCSNYMIQAIEKHGFKGVLMGLSRILRCHPWSKTGKDPVPDHFSLKRNHK